MLLKRTLIFLMLVAVLNQTFNTLSTLVAFQMNRQYITEMLCVNKNRPELHCDGKCVLMQRMTSEIDKAQAKGQQMLKNLIEREVFAFFENIKFFISKDSSIIDFHLNTLIAYTPQYKPQSCHSDIFHPPTIG